MKAAFAIGAGIALLALTSASFAHHSYAMFDRDKTVALTGTVKQFKWSNPHAWMEVYVPNDKGGTDTWGVEMNSPNNLARVGFRSTMVKPGDKVTVRIHPLRSGEKGGSFLSVTLPSGQTFSDAPKALTSSNGQSGKAADAKSPY